MVFGNYGIDCPLKEFPFAIPSGLGQRPAIVFKLIGAQADLSRQFNSSNRSLEGIRPQEPWDSAFHSFGLSLDAATGQQDWLGQGINIVFTRK
ncbi:MAG: hypothetical protein AB2728_19880 [Candidatus Thiodiazotropha sp.]